jgi:DNA repair exonuclease SbcCD ATPase subunit
MVVIAGANESGKTSLLDSIDVALCGIKNMPAHPVRKGAKSGRIQIDLGDYKITRLFSETANNNVLSKLQIEGKSREQFKTPQALLDSLMGEISFDPLEFTRMKPEKQLETLRGLVKVELDIDALDQQQKADYDERRIVGREIDALKARLAAMPEYADAPDEPVDIEALSQQISSAVTHNEAISQDEAELEELRAEEQRLGQKVKAAVVEIKELEERIERLREGIREDGNQAAAIELQIKTFPPIAERINIAHLSEQMSRATWINNEVRGKKAHAAAAAELQQAEAKHDEIDVRMTARMEERTQAIASAKMPVDGLNFGEKMVLWDGLPFDQASQAVQIRVSVAIAMASNPTIRVLRIKDGSLLDAKSRAVIEQMAAEHDYQVWMELVDTSGKVGVVMEDGEASGEEVENAG